MSDEQRAVFCDKLESKGFDCHDVDDILLCLAEAQRAYDNAKPGDCIQIDPELWPYINRTGKDVAVYSDEVTDFPRINRTEK